MKFEDLVDQNPWWKGKDGINKDPDIKKFQNTTIKWRPRMMYFFDLERDIIYTIRGPRQVGKTTLMKLIIKDIISRQVEPRHIMYLTCDVIDDKKELLEIIDEFLDFSRGQAQEGRRYLFIDEVPSVRDWPKTIKVLADVGKLKDVTVFLTGSHSIDLKYSIERLPGRRGEGKGTFNKMLIPMKFAEYVETIDKDLFTELGDLFYMTRVERQRIVLDLFEGKIDPIIEFKMKVYRKELKRHLDNYLLTGGIIQAIAAYHLNGEIDRSFYELYIRSMIGDLGKWRFRENIAKQILRSVSMKMTNRVSLNTIAKENEIGSHNTVSAYLEALEDCFVLNTVYQMDLGRKRINTKKERKVYISDPFIFNAIKGWVMGSSDYLEISRNMLLDSVEKSRIVEMVTLNHIIRFAYGLDPTDVFSHHEKVMFWKKKGTDREVDFILKYNEKIFPFEVKYRTNLGRRDLANLFPLKKGIIISKNKLDTYNKYSFIPLDLFLLLI